MIAPPASLDRLAEGDGLAREHARMKMIFDGMNDQFFALDSGWRYTFFNKRAEEQLRSLGLDSAQLIGKVLWDVFPAVPNEASLRRVMDKRVPVTDELFYEPLGEWVQNHIYPSPDGGVAIFQRYVTEARIAEAALRRSQEALEHVARVATMGELVASIAHELNQPLAAIVAHGNAGLRWLERGEDAIAETRNAFDRIIRDGTRAGDVLRHVRALVTPADRTRVPVPLEEVVADVVTLVQHDTKSRDVTIHTRTTGKPPPVMGDRVQLQQVVLNLTLNAMEAMCTTIGRPRVLLIETRRTPEGVSVSMNDTGPGFEEHDAAKLFDAFYTTKRGGLGMGLAISRTIVEAHGGRIWATTRPGEGATFEFVLPLNSNSSSR
jgi:C4-dicarboxylate-specific signal transduction histidine kinase